VGVVRACLQDDGGSVKMALIKKNGKTERKENVET
jgi:hypothetical protein